MRCAAVVALRASMAMWMLPTRRCFVALEDQELLLSCLASFGGGADRADRDRGGIVALEDQELLLSLPCLVRCRFVRVAQRTSHGFSTLTASKGLCNKFMDVVASPTYLER